ncbi:MAG: glycosyltransferase family 9 protein [Planctomycetota bacterium]|jgi:lipopolysaccharide heptosyltransferase II
MQKFNSRKLVYGRCVDLVLSIIYTVSHPFKKKYDDIKHSRPEKILILESHLIGDIVMGTVAYRAIRERYPYAKLVLLANMWAKELLSDQRLFDEIIPVKYPWSTYDYTLKNLSHLFKVVRRLRRDRYDLAIDFRGDLRNILILYLSKAKRRVGYDFTGGGYLLTDIVPCTDNIKHRVDVDLNVASYLGCHIENSRPRLVVTCKSRTYASHYFCRNNLNNNALVIGVHPGATADVKKWSVKKFALLIDTLYARFSPNILLFGARADEELLDSILKRVSRGKPWKIIDSLANFAAFVEKCDLFIGVDSGPVHIASAVGTPCICIFGPARPEYTAPYGPDSYVIFKRNFECRPCDQKTCRKPPGSSCMDAIEVDDVLARIDEIVNKHNTQRT